MSNEIIELRLKIVQLIMNEPYSTLKGLFELLYENNYPCAIELLEEQFNYLSHSIKYECKKTIRKALNELSKNNVEDAVKLLKLALKK